MKNIEEFIEHLVRVDYLEESNAYGHYPFQMFAETKEGKNELNALALGGMVQAVYNRFKQYYCNGAKRIYLSLDFSALLDIETDFVAVFSFEYGAFNIFAIPYNTTTGELFPRVEKAESLNRIMVDFKKHIPYD